MIWTKGAHQSAKFQTFNCSGEISPNLYFDRLLDKISAKKVQRRYVSWHWRVMQNLKRTQFFVSKMTRIWWILIRAFRSLKNLHFDWSFLCKVYNIWPIKYRGVICHDTEVSYKIWEKTDLWSGKWYEEFGKISPEHSKVSKLGHDNEEWWKGIDLVFRNWHEGFNEFWPKHSKISKICTLIGCFWPNYMFELRKYRGAMFYGNWKLTCASKNEISNLANFHQSTWKSQNWDFDRILLSKVENVWAQNLQDSYVPWE